MASNIFKVSRAVQKEIKQLLIERKKESLPVDFVDGHDAMVILHREWQSLITELRKHDINRHAVRMATKLAASAMKFAMDLDQGEKHTKQPRRSRKIRFD